MNSVLGCNRDGQLPASIINQYKTIEAFFFFCYRSIGNKAT